MSISAISSAAQPLTSDTPDRTEVAFVAKLAEEIAGLSLPPSKEPMVRARLLRRMRALKLGSLKDYCAYLQSDAGSGELEELIIALTTNVTNFYREVHHFDYLRSEILPDLMARARSGERVRIWSAGCSTGEEPLSIALDVLAACPEAPKLDVRILATDINTAVLQKAQSSSYPEETLAPVIERHGRSDFSADTSSPGHLVFSERSRSLITHRPLNLVQPWPVHGPFQVIFCRNVIIYFSAETQSSLWPKFQSVMDSGGHLFLGHSERLEEPDKYSAKPVATTTYRFQ